MDAARAAIRHPWRGAALAASMPLGPLRETCVQPAPKSRSAVSGLSVYEDQKQIRSRSEADQKRIKGGLRPKDTGGLVGVSLLAKALVHPPNNWCLKCSIREQARSHRMGVRSAKLLAPGLSSSRLKPVPLKAPRTPRGTCFADRALAPRGYASQDAPRPFPAEAGPTECTRCPVGPASAGKASIVMP